MSIASVRFYGFFGCAHSVALYAVWAIGDHGINVLIDCALGTIFLGAMVAFPFYHRGKSKK